MIRQLSIASSDYVYHYDNSQTLTEEALLNYLNKGVGKFIPKTIEKVNVCDHVLERWRTRVHPNMSDGEIKEYIQMAFLSNRIIFTHGVAHIDNDIYFACVKTGPTIELVTTYGREKLLSKEIDMVRYIKYYKDAKDHITLEPSEEDMLSIHLPILPETYIKYKGSQVHYRIAVYKTQQGKIYDVEASSGIKARTLCSHRDLDKLTKSNRKVLKQLYQTT